MEIVQPPLTPEKQRDDLLLRKARAGDRSAFAELYQSHAAGIHRYALHMTGNSSLADEALQETFLAVLRDTSGYDGHRGTLGAYLFGIARNRIRRQMALDREFDEPDVGVVAAGDPFEDLIRQETIDAVRQAVLKLPASYREAIVLCELEEMAYEEAAALMGCPVGTVRSRLHRGRALLLARLTGLKQQRVNV